jgi:hypothetical protein
MGMNTVPRATVDGSRAAVVAGQPLPGGQCVARVAGCFSSGVLIASSLAARDPTTVLHYTTFTLPAGGPRLTTLQTIEPAARSTNRTPTLACAEQARVTP